MGKRKKKKMIPFWVNKLEENQNSANIMISVDGKGKVFPKTLKLQMGIVWIKILEKKLKKGLMNLIEKKHQINMSSDHSVSSNN